MMVCVLIFASILLGFAELSKNSPLKFSKEEESWLEDHKRDTLNLGLDPFSGMDYFNYLGSPKGYVIDFVKLLNQETGLNVEIIGDRSWSEVYQGLQTKEIDILFGANVTEERLEFMAFTRPVHQYPYAMFALKDGAVMTIGDVDKKKLAFIADDIAIDLIPEIYNRITYTQYIYDSQQEAVEALLNNKVNAFITSGGSVADQFLYTYPELKTVAQFKTITSDMTLSTLKDNQMLIGILDKVIAAHMPEINQMIQKAIFEYNWLILDLNEAEVSYILSMRDSVKVAVTKDYLPFEYQLNEQAGGIFVSYFNRLSEVVGIPFTFVSGDFNPLYQELKDNSIQAMNLAKTEERKNEFIFTDAFGTERDEIYGYKALPYVGDIYNLENKRIAIVRGYYQKDYLSKNLNKVQWVEVDNIQDALRLVNLNKADYIIENPTVVQYYTDELKFYNISKKGETGSDSLLYIALNKDNAVLQSIINKSMRLLDFDEIKNNALIDVPHISTNTTGRLFLVIVGLVILIVVVGLYLVKVSHNLIDERSKLKVMEERQKLLYIDPMTNLKNRQFYNKIEASLNDFPFPQIYLMIDLNNLKYVNDNYGHFVGDEYIVKFASLLTQVLPERSMIMRMGGDEFLVIVPDCTYEDGKTLIATVADLGSKTEFYKALKMDNPWASYGLTERLTNELSVIDVIQKADNFMYDNKRKGRRS
jgi:diguanylate cyclase (GGDEF)-like protein